jgi:hypothetical protein
MYVEEEHTYKGDLYKFSRSPMIMGGAQRWRGGEERGEGGMYTCAPSI